MELARKQIRTRSFVASVLFLAALGVACAPPVLRRTNGGQFFRPTPAPPFSPPIRNVPRQAIINYAEGQLEFSTDVGASDEQHLLFPPARVGERPTAGPRARVDPEIGAGTLAHANMAQGRIIARITVHDNTPYPRLRLPGRGTYYLWVDRHGGAWKAYMIPANPNLPIEDLTLTIHSNSHRRDPRLVRFPRARWFYSDNPGSELWGDCSGECCVSCDATSLACAHPAY